MSKADLEPNPVDTQACALLTQPHPLLHNQESSLLPAAPFPSPGLVGVVVKGPSEAKKSPDVQHAVMPI